LQSVVEKPLLFSKSNEIHWRARCRLSQASANLARQTPQRGLSENAKIYGNSGEGGTGNRDDSRIRN
jgi:hypothetical protein